MQWIDNPDSYKNDDHVSQCLRAGRSNPTKGTDEVFLSRALQEYKRDLAPLVFHDSGPLANSYVDQQTGQAVLPFVYRGTALRRWPKAADVHTRWWSL